MSKRLAISSELQEICHFLHQFSPFAELSIDDLVSIAPEIVISYHRANSRIEMGERDQRRLYIVRSGAIMISDEHNKLLDKVSTGGYFGYPSLLADHHITNIVEAIEDSLVYRLRVNAFQHLRDNHPHFSRFFEAQYARRLNIALQNRQQGSIYTDQVSMHMSDKLISVSPSTSILNASQLMTEKGISCLTIVDKEEQLSGILTDRDLRMRVIAEQKSYDISISEVMTTNPIVIDKDAFIDQAILLMMQKNVHHLIVMDDDPKLVPIGILTVTDLIKKQKSEPILLIGSIYKAKTIEELVNASHHIKGLLRNLIAADAKAEVLGRLLTTVTDALTQRLIQLAQVLYGKEPVPFSWIAFGSQGREDQSAKSDQDNGLILHDQFQQEHDEYFKKLADFVCDGLNECGYIYCPGGIMASNIKWRQPLHVWQKMFIHWVEKPDPESLLNSSIFFDVRQIYSSSGDNKLIDSLQTALKNIKKKEQFLGMMTVNALQLQPPIGFFNQFVVDRSGEHKNTFNIKARGIMPINDIARIHALANNITEANTFERLRILEEKKILTAEQVSSLLDALEFIAHARLIHQGNQMNQGDVIDNHLDPNQLSTLIQHQIKDAFQIIRDGQTTLRVRYAHNLPI